jgi:uncharacterized protein YjdB
MAKTGELLINISNQMAATITTDNGTYQVTATILPLDATDKSLTWVISNGMGNATVDNNGLVTAVSNGTVTVKATANDGSGVFGTLDIVITNQKVLITSIVLT